MTGNRTDRITGRGLRGAVPSRSLVAALAATATAGAAGCSESGDDRAKRPADPPARIVTERTPDSGTAAPRRLARPLEAGTVRVEPGPFTDRVLVRGLRLSGGQRPRVTGRLVNRVDVSEVLALDLRADFYDRAGRLVASGTRSFGESEEFGQEPLAFTVVASTAAPTADAAVFSIPQLVNE